MVEPTTSSQLVYKGTKLEYIQDCFRFYKTIAQRRWESTKYYISNYPTVFICYGSFGLVLSFIYFREHRKLKNAIKLAKQQLPEVKKERMYNLVKEANEIKKLGK